MSTEIKNDNPAVEQFSSFDLDAELQGFQDHKPWQSRIRSKTLSKKAGLHLVLIAMESGAQMHEHHADGAITVHILRGAIKMRILGQTVDLASGRLLAVDPSIKHDVEALQDSAFLLSISWPTRRDLVAIEHRGTGYNT